MKFAFACASLLLLVCVRSTVAAEVKPLLDVTSDDAIGAIATSSGQVTVAKSTDPAAPGVNVSISTGADGYPGITLKPADGVFDLSAFGHVEAKIVNTGEKQIGVAVRVDNNGDWKDNPSNTEVTYIKPGASGLVHVRFGFSWGKPSFKLDSAAVSKILVFLNKANVEQTFRIEYLQAGGEPGEKPPVDPNTVRVKPVDGVMLGAGTTLAADKQLVAKNAEAAVETNGDKVALRLTFTAGKAEQSVAYKPAVGRWDLRDALEVRVTLRNAGTAPVKPRIRVDSNGGATNAATPDAPLAPGDSVELVVPFRADTTWDGTKPKETGDRVTNDAVTNITFGVEKSDSPRVLVVDSIRATVPTPPALPEWLGQRPPVDGQWTQTFSDDFNGNEIDATRWNVYGENYWDQKSHFSKDNVTVAGGFAKLRFEKKRGHQNDDPNHKRVTDYATGFLQTYGKWTQKYGYFESRMKLPTAPGLWPAFWMMPDRGPASDPQWKRQDTKLGGMEFDIMEHLTRWGPYRYNIAMHWDGYEKDHKHIGSDKVYFQPDADGFVTAGVLWTPGELVYFSQGKEVGRWKNDRVSNVPAEMMFTLPMGGWDNNALDDTKLPDDFTIDWVRAWQRNDLAGETPKN